MTYRDELRLLHDTDLARVDAPEARVVLDGRERSAAQIRLTLAHVYGIDDPRQWHRLPMLTDTGTLGVLDIAAGTAWDTQTPADPGVADLGLSPAGEPVYAAAGMSPGAGGDVSLGWRQPDGTILWDTIQSQGTAIVDNQIVPPSAPHGWRQIALPTWRGYHGSGYARVPIAEYAPDRC